MKKLLSICLALSACIVAGAQDWTTMDMKNWSEGPLAFDDFTTRKSGDTTVVGHIAWTYRFENEKHKTGNLKYETYKVDLLMDKLKSWYDPEQGLFAPTYFQAEFDMAEVTRRRMQSEMNRNPRESADISQYYFRIIENRIGTYEQESRHGRDHDAVERYAAAVRAELDTVGIEPLQAPEIGKKKNGIGMFIGYGAELFGGPASAGVPMGNALDWGFGFPVRRWSIIVDMCLGIGSPLKTDGFYHDSRYDYDWARGKNVTSSSMNIIGGYHILDKDYWAVMPLAGFGVGFMDQKMDAEHTKDKNSTSSETAGFRLLAGLQLSCKLARTIYGVTDGGLSESTVNFRIYGASTDYRQVGRSYSINFGITLDWTAFSLR